MKIGVLFDENGNFAGDCLDGTEIPEGYTLFQNEMPEGLYQPRLVDNVVVEGLALEDILVPLKVAKIEELWNACNQSILSPFVSSALGEEHTYGFDEMDQMNLTGAAAAINLGIIGDSIEWKTKNAGYKIHSINQFIQVCADAFARKEMFIRRYGVLKDQVLSSSTIEELQLRSW